MEKTQKTRKNVLRARNVQAKYYAVCGLFFLLGMGLFLFMVVICFMAKKSGSTQMLVLLDALEIIPVLGLTVCNLRMAVICRGKMNDSRAAVERRNDGSARLEYPVGQKRYYLDLRKEKRPKEAGMIKIWYEESNPRNVFFGSKPPQKASFYGIANLGVLLVLCAAVNAVFFLLLR